MVEWNALVKPILYGWALVFSTVVLGLTADKLLLTPPEVKSTTCALRGNLSTCIYTIISGSSCILITIFVATKRLIAVFSSDDQQAVTAYPKVMEAIWWLVLSVWWFITAIVVTSKLGTGENGIPGPTLVAERAVVTVFSWLLWVGYMIMAILAWLAPESDSDAVYEEIRKYVKMKKEREAREKVEQEKLEAERKAQEGDAEGEGEPVDGEKSRLFKLLSSKREDSTAQEKDANIKSAPAANVLGGKEYSWRPTGLFRRRPTKIAPQELERAKSGPAISLENVQDLPHTSTETNAVEDDTASVDTVIRH